MPSTSTPTSPEMGDQNRSKRPKRCSTRRNPEAFLYALSWQEERDIQRAMYKSLKERRLEPPATRDTSPLPLEPIPAQAIRKSPRLKVGSRSESFDGDNKNLSDNGGDNMDEQQSTASEGVRTRQQVKPNRPLLMRASSSSTLEENNFPTSKPENGSTATEFNPNQPVVKKRILAPRRSMGEIPVELWVDPNGKPVVTRDFLDFLCYRGSSGLPQKLAWFELAPHKRPQAQLFTTGNRGASVSRPRVAARGKRTSVSGGLISDSSSNSGGSTGLSRRNSGQSSPSGEDSGLVNGNRRISSRDLNRPRKKSRSLFYQIMTAKLRRLQNTSGVGKRTSSKSPVPSPPLQTSANVSNAATTKRKTAGASSTIARRAAKRAVLRRSHRVRQKSPNNYRLQREESEDKPVNGNTKRTVRNNTSGKSNTILTRQRSKDFMLRSKNLRRR